MSEEMDSYQSSKIADKAIEEATEMFNDPNVGRIKKGFAVVFGVISIWHRVSIATKARERLKAKSKYLLKSTK